MTQTVFMAVAIATVIFLIVSFATDIRERMIYVFPCIMLALTWGLMGFVGVHDMAFVMTIILLHMFVYSLLRLFSIWGDGDSDMFLLYGAVYAAYMMVVTNKVSLSGYLIGELMGMVAALLLSLAIGFVEAKVRKKKMDKGSSIAVVPGFVIVMVFFIIKILLVR